MGFVDSVKNQLRPLPPGNAANEVDMAEVAPQGAPPEADPADEKGTGLESQEAGVSAIEGAQTIWGKRGRWLIICG